MFEKVKMHCMEQTKYFSVYYSMPCVWNVCLAQDTCNYGVKCPVVPLSQD